MKTLSHMSLVVVGLFFLYTMVCFSVSRYVFITVSHKNYMSELRVSDAGFSVSGLLRALSFLPVKVLPFQNDMDGSEIHGYTGRTYLNMAKQTADRTGSEYKDLLVQAEKQYRLSAGLNPHDLDAARGLAEAAFLLEKAGNPGADALPFFKQLSRLGPNHVENHFFIASYYHYKGLEEQFLETVTHLTAVYPQGYGRIKKEKFYSQDLKPGIHKGLETAMGNDFTIKQGCFAMAQFLRDEGDPDEGLAFYQKGLSVRPGENKGSNFVDLGRMQVEAGQTEPAFTSFETAIKMTRGSEIILKQIYGIFKTRGELEAFLTFTGRIDPARAFPSSFGIYIAKARIELGLYELAKTRLIDMIAEKQDAETFYLLALIGEKQKDWDAMEINIQKATLLDPSNCNYYTLFAKSLQAQGKKTQADFQQQKAKACIQSKKN